MGNEHDSHTLALDLPQAIKAFDLEVGIAHCQDFIDQKDIRIHIDGNGECQAHIHSGRIGAHRVIDKLLQLGKGDDLFQARIDFFLGKPENSGINIDIFPAAHIRMEPGAQLY